MTPLVTVLMPAYNAEKYITAAINSVLQQTFTNFELLVINDGSADSTEAIINSFTDNRIRLINQTNQGVAAALNIGLLNAKAELIARFDADDLCTANRLQLQYDFLSANPDYIIVGADADYINNDDEYIFTGRLPAYVNEDIQHLNYARCPFIHSAVMYRKKYILEAGGYNIHAHAFEDHLLWSKIIRQNKTHNLSETLIKVRLNPASVSIDEKWRTRRFLEIKYRSIRQGDISEEDGRELLFILKKQDTQKIKEASYYSLLGKKYTWDNYQPQKARNYLTKAIRIHPGRIESYLVMLLSFFPKPFIDWLYKRKLNKI